MICTYFSGKVVKLQLHCNVCRESVDDVMERELDWHYLAQEAGDLLGSVVEPADFPDHADAEEELGQDRRYVMDL